MGGGGSNLVDGLLRWLFFQRRPSSSSNTHDQIHNPDNLVDNDGDSKNPNGIEDLDPSKLKLIKVPKRDHSPMDAQKKVNEQLSKPNQTKTESDPNRLKEYLNGT